MPMAGGDIIALIEAAIPGARVQLTDLAGDNDHWAAEVTASAFAGLSRVKQHQMVYQALGGRMGGALHALKLTTLAPETGAGNMAPETGAGNLAPETGAGNLAPETGAAKG